MKRQVFQPGEIRDENDAIIREGAYGKKSAFATADNRGILDYMINNFDALYDAVNGGRVYVASASDLPKTGDTAAVYIVEDSGKWYYWDSKTAAYITMDNARTIANEAIAARDAAQASQTAAKTSEMNAKTSETNAGNSQSAAASSASAASSSASAASTSATNAGNSQTAAASSASAAKTSEINAATSETNAKTALVSCQNIQTQVNNGLQSLTSAVKYRGSVASFSALPTSGQSVGDMYNVKAAGGTDANGTAIRAGDNVVWNGSGWDDQAGTVDLSNYYTKSEMNGAVVSATVSDATLTLIHKDASISTVTVNNVAHASKASQDDKGQAIDIAALNTLITSTSAYKNQLQRNKTYSVGDIAYSPSLPSWARLECVTAGTTGASAPSSLTTVSSGGVLISDGTVTWIVDDVRDMTPVGCVRGSLFLPKGYIKANGATVQRADYPRLVYFIEINNLWTDDTTNNSGLFGKGDGSSTFVLPDYRERMMQYTEGSIGAKRDAGIPNITGQNKGLLLADRGEKTFKGAFIYGGVENPNDGSIDGTNGNPDVVGYTLSGSAKLIIFNFDAHVSNNIYGSSATVQPPAINVIPIIRY